MVSSSTACTGSVLESSMAIAPICSASASRSGWRSTTMTFAAPLIVADRAAISPTGPAPAITTLSPGITPAISVAW
ncbi:hypothetical protein ACFFX0_25445 [Citricoccus parietis]|uniref:Uncharacterized protein n=1 Tax=Citricoccus parietis TaxID=592307 RepID=A0ABV5G5Y7_9MICC